MPMVFWGRVKSVCPFACYAVSSITTGWNSTKFVKWLAYTSGWCARPHLFLEPLPMVSSGRVKVSVHLPVTLFPLLDGIQPTLLSDFLTQVGCARPYLFLEPRAHGVPRRGEICLSICLLHRLLLNCWTEFNQICWVRLAYTSGWCARPHLFLEPHTHGFLGKGEKFLSICLLRCLLYNCWTEFNQICWVTCVYQWSVQEYIYLWVPLHMGPQKGVKSVQLFVYLHVMLSSPKPLDWVQPNVLNVTCFNP